MALVAAALAIPAHAVTADQYTDKIGADKRQQQQITQQIASLKAQIAAAQNQEAQLQSIISGLDTKIAAAQTAVINAQGKLAQITEDLAIARTELSRAQVQLEAEKQHLSKQVVLIYELQQRSTPLNNLLTSQNFNAFWTNVIDSRRISDQELESVAQIFQQEDVVNADIAAISAKQAQQRQVVSQLAADELQLHGQRDAQQEAVNYLQRLQAQDQVRMQEMQAAYNALNGQIAQLQQEEQAALAAGGGSGRFAWPDSGAITQGFGCTTFQFEPYDPSCSTLHFHNGIDIAGPCGENILAADSGIAHEYWQAYGFGNYIIIVHGNGWETLYGHMSGFAVGDGQQVHRGQVIGYEGTTGNSTGCHLHFSVNRDNNWVNPLAYLS